MLVTLTSEVVAAMHAAFPDQPSSLHADYYARMEYHLGWRSADLSPAPSDGGKLVRPLLAVLVCEALGGTRAHALPLAAGLQLVHDFSLIHDDIEDHSPQRRGRATVWSIWGMEQGINIGDGLFAIAHRSLHRLVDIGVDAATTLAVLRGFEEAILRICEGQHLDISGEGRFDVSTARYLEMIRGKTAALIAASTGLGARLATDDSVVVDRMTSFGEAVGMAFQIEDDILDIWGDPARTGKPQAADLQSRKLSLPVIHALEHATLTERATFERIYRQPADPADLPALFAILDRTDARSAAGALADRYHHQAEEALAAIEPRNQEAFSALRQLFDSLLRRTH